MNKKLLRKKLALMLANLKKKRPFYTEVEYIKPQTLTSADEYTTRIDTGISPTANTEVIADIEPLDYNGGDQTIGARTGTGSANRFFIYSMSSNGRVVMGGNSTTNLNLTGTRFKIKFNETNTHRVYVNDTLITTFNASLYTNANDNHLLLFATTGYEPAYGVSNTKIYRCQIREAGTLVRDFIPVLDWDMIPCMYDRVSGELFYNAGTGDFIAGREIHPVDYIESTGTQYIDTEHAFTDDFSWEIDFEGLTKGATLFGGRTSSIRTAILYQKLATQGVETTCPIASMSGDTTPFQLADLSTGRHKVKMSVSSNKGSVWVDGTQVYNNQSFSGTYISGTTQAIFADNFGSSVSEYTSSKFYGLKMWQGSTLVRDFVPAIDENGVGFVFDKVTNTIYDNAGTGAFNYSPVELEYIESTGTQYVDTGYYPNNTTKYDLKISLLNPATTQSYMGIIGVSVTPNNRCGMGFYNGKIRQQFGSGAAVYGGNYNDSSYTGFNNPTTYECSRNGFYINGVLNWSPTKDFTGTSSVTALLFNTHAEAEYSGTPQRLYYCKIYNNGTVARDFIPCYKNGVLGIWDKVNEVFYPNAGQGAFVGGSVREPEYE